MPALYYCWFPVIILGFIALYVMQNLWRPVLISRFDAHSDEAMGATILSIESQAKSVATMIIAPGLGYVVDLMQARMIGCLAVLACGHFRCGCGSGLFRDSENADSEPRTGLNQKYKPAVARDGG